MNQNNKTIREINPIGYEVDQILMEATQQVEDELKLEDQGWFNLSTSSTDVITDAARILNVQTSRLYYLKDPLGKQSIRLWTDYTFGPGMAWKTEFDDAKKVLESYWNAGENRNILSARGQRRSSDKLLVDGEVFFAIFLGASSSTPVIRRIDPLEITEILTNPEDVEDIKLYKREWTDPQGKIHTDYYRDINNVKGEPGIDSISKSHKHTQEAFIYHVSYNTISRRGNPLLLPALDWIKQYRRFLASRIAVMLSLARFAWKSKVMGGQTKVDSVKATTNEKEIAAGSHLFENMGIETTPIKTESGASQAYQDGRMIKLQIAAAVGIPEQYFGDISIGNLATAKTVELPMMKMFQSYQMVWNDSYQDLDEFILEQRGVSPEHWYIDRDFPAIAPADVLAVAQSITSILQVMPEFAYSPDVQQIALLSLGINDPAEVLDAINKEAKKNPSIELTKALKNFKEILNGNHN